MIGMTETLGISLASYLPPKSSLPEGIMTNLKSLITPTALLVAFTFAAAPTFAQERAHGRQGQQASGQQAQPRSQGPHAQAQPQAQAPQPRAGAAPRVETRQEPPRA